MCLMRRLGGLWWGVGWFRIGEGARGGSGVGFGGVEIGGEVHHRLRGVVACRHGHTASTKFRQKAQL